MHGEKKKSRMGGEKKRKGEKKEKEKRGTPPFPVMYMHRGSETCGDHRGRPGYKTDGSSDPQTEQCGHALRNP